MALNELQQRVQERIEYVEAKYAKVFKSDAKRAEYLAKIKKFLAETVK